MKTQPLLIAITTALMAAAAAQNAIAENDANATATSSTIPADNTKSNKLDSSNTSATADAQKDNPNDRTITQQIRKSVFSDKSLSTYAHNVKIVSINGTVTLNGVVRSDTEKSTIEAKAVAVAGQNRVINDLKVTPPKS